MGSENWGKFDHVYEPNITGNEPEDKFSGFGAGNHLDPAWASKTQADKGFRTIEWVDYGASRVSLLATYCLVRWY